MRYGSWHRQTGIQPSSVVNDLVWREGGRCPRDTCFHGATRRFHREKASRRFAESSSASLFKLLDDARKDPWGSDCCVLKNLENLTFTETDSVCFSFSVWKKREAANQDVMELIRTVGGVEQSAVRHIENFLFLLIKKQGLINARGLYGALTRFSE